MQSFKGGIHPAEFKDTAGLAVESAPLPTRVVLPLSQHTGSHAKSIVKAKDEVKTGQLIAEASGFISAALHASVSGKVVGIETVQHPGGFTMDAIVIESDGLDTPCDRAPLDPAAITAEAIVARVKDAGIVGLGGAAFPTHVKLAPPREKKIDTALLNGCECEPFLTCDHRVMLEETAKVVTGFRLIMKALGVSRGIIALEENKPDAASALRAIVGDAGDLQVLSLRTRYPQGAEKQLIKASVNREVPSGGLPMDVGCVVQNVQTAKAVFEAIAEGKPLYERVLTVAGAVRAPKNLRVRIGTSVADLVALCGGLKDEARKLVIGGPMMGTTQHTLDVPVVKGTSGILALDATLAARVEPTPCIRCGRCIIACPMGLSPTVLARMTATRGADAAAELKVNGAMDCIECGSCAFECPALIPLAQMLRVSKQIVRKIKTT